MIAGIGCVKFFFGINIMPILKSFNHGPELKYKNDVFQKEIFCKQEFYSMKNIFPEPVTKLPKADIPIDGITAYLSQSDSHQVIFMQFDKDADLPEHSHESQWGVVLEGRIDLVIDGIRNTYIKGDRYFIGKDIKHSGKIYAGYADITFFNEKNRYGRK